MVTFLPFPRLAADSMLKQGLDATMLFPQYQVAADACQAEIEAYNDAAEATCKLNKELGIWNYGDFWVNTIWPSMAQNAPSTNGAAYNDGAYDLATMFGGNANFTILDPLNIPTVEEFTNVCFADCYTGGEWCEWAYDIIPPAEFGIPTIFIRGAMPTITVEEYCKSGIHDIDAAYMGMKVCAQKAIGAIPVNGMSLEEMAAALEAQAANNIACSVALCESVQMSASLLEGSLGTSPAAVGVSASSTAVLVATFLVLAVGFFL